MSCLSPLRYHFLTWLRLANLQPSISFESDQLLLRDGLVSGEFSWITCSGAWLQGLQKRMGSKLGTCIVAIFSNRTSTGPFECENMGIWFSIQLDSA